MGEAGPLNSHQMQDVFVGRLDQDEHRTVAAERETFGEILVQRVVKPQGGDAMGDDRACLTDHVALKAAAAYLPRPPAGLGDDPAAWSAR